MASQAAVPASSSSARLSFSTKAHFSSSVKASLLRSCSFQGLCDGSLCRACLLRRTPGRRASASAFSSSSSPHPLLVTAVGFRTNIIHETGDAAWDIHGQSHQLQPRTNATIVASLDSDAGKAEGARKALEQAFQGKSNIAKKWEEEIKKRELSGGDGGSGGWSGGGGGGDDEEMGDFGQDEPWDWEEAGQTFMATFGLIILYVSITHGPKSLLKKLKLLIRFIRQGFRLKKIPDKYLTAEGSGIPSDDEEEGDSDDEDEDAEVNLIHNRWSAKSSLSNIRDADVKMNDLLHDKTEDDNAPTPSKDQSKREDLLSKRQAEQKEKLIQLLTPKELKQQEETK